jgi:hypothetical protein
MVARDRFKYRFKLSGLKRNFGFFVENSHEMRLKRGFKVVERCLECWETWAFKLTVETWFNGNRRFLQKKYLGVEPISSTGEGRIVEKSNFWNNAHTAVIGHVNIRI